MASTPDVVWLDVETTGLDHERHAVLEIAAVRIDAAGQVKAHMGALLWPVDLERANPKALAINGFNEALWRERGTPPDRALDQLAWVLGDEQPVVGGHNVAFDLRFLSRVLPWLRPRYTVDTASLAWPRMLRGEIAKCSLDTLVEAFGIASRHLRHSALGDIDLTLGVFAALTGQPRPCLDAIPSPREVP